MSRYWIHTIGNYVTGGALNMFQNMSWVHTSRFDAFAIWTDPFTIWPDPLAIWSDPFEIWTDPFDIWTDPFAVWTDPF
jgi:hypothetical protein